MAGLLITSLNRMQGLKTKMSAPELIVLHSLAAPDGPTKYAVQMQDSAPDGVQTLFFSWRAAIFGKYDVFHVHWPEFLLRHDRLAFRALQAVLYTVLLIRIRLRNTAVVRTLHNTQPHEDSNALESFLLNLLERRTDCFIRLNPTTMPPVDRPVSTVPHGHYVDRFSHLSRLPSVSGRILYFGLIRPYKGVENLLDVFVSESHTDLHLRVVGKPLTVSLRSQIESVISSDPRVSGDLRFVDDAQLVEEFSEAELIVLPYKEMHNSGVLLVAISLGRPVLVPATPSNLWLVEEVGSEWIITYEEDITFDIIRSALRTARNTLATGESPDLGGRDWEEVGKQHEAVYQAAIRDRRKR